MEIHLCVCVCVSYWIIPCDTTDKALYTVTDAQWECGMLIDSTEQSVRTQPSTDTSLYTTILYTLST